MQVYAGIDEAGYGPLLGPLCIGASVFVMENGDWAHGPPDLWKELRRCVCRAPSDRRRRVAIDDSKRLKGPNDGKSHPLRHLERGVLAFTMAQSAAGSRARAVAMSAMSDMSDMSDMSAAQTEASGSPAHDPDDEHATLPEVDGDLLAHLHCAVPDPALAPWYDSTTAIPLAHDAAQLRLTGLSLRRGLEMAGVECPLLRCSGIDAEAFNERLALTRSKAAVSFDEVVRLLNAIWTRWADDHPRVVVDRQGGRHHYRETLSLCFPEASITILGETERVSRYRLERDGSQLTVSFEAESECAHLPVALASMTAKLCRELLMLRLNRWFTGQRPELRHTAGYVKDGRRWLADAAPLINELGIDRRRLVREA